MAKKRATQNKRKKECSKCAAASGRKGRTKGRSKGRRVKGAGSPGTFAKSRSSGLIARPNYVFNTVHPDFVTPRLIQHTGRMDLEPSTILPTNTTTSVPKPVTLLSSAPSIATETRREPHVAWSVAENDLKQTTPKLKQNTPLVKNIDENKQLDTFYQSEAAVPFFNNPLYVKRLRKPRSTPRHNFNDLGDQGREDKPSIINPLIDTLSDGTYVQKSPVGEALSSTWDSYGNPATPQARSYMTGLPPNVTIRSKFIDKYRRSNSNV